MLQAGLNHMSINLFEANIPLGDHEKLAAQNQKESAREA